MPLVIAHRGASAYAPENTLRAFELARTMGADMIELDVQRSADGVLVVFHDDTTERWDGQPRAINACTLDELRVLDIGGERVATFAETCAFAQASGMALNVELKQPDIAAPVAAMLREYGIVEQILVSSFYPEALAALRETAPEIERAFLMDADAYKLSAPTSEPWPVPHLRALDARTWHPAANTPALADVLPAVRAAGYNINVWTVNDPNLARQLLAWGATGIITDKPDIMRIEV